MTRPVSYVHQFGRDIRERKPEALALGVTMIAGAGALGSFFGQWWSVVPSQSFGNVGDWIAGIAAVAALLGISRQIEVSRELHTAGQDERKLSEWAAQCRASCLDLQEIAVAIIESEPLGVAFRRDPAEVRDMIRVCAGRLRALQVSSVRLASHPLNEAQDLLVQWLQCSGSEAGGRVARGFVRRNEELLRMLQDNAIAPRE